jgi:hypothetical protein
MNITKIKDKWYATKEEAQEVKSMGDEDEEFKELILEQWQKASDEEKDDWAVKLEKLKQIQTIMKKKSKYKSPNIVNTDDDGNPIEDEEDGEENTISEKTLDTIIEAVQNGANPEWLILQGTRASKAAARAWINASKRIEARRVAAEKAKRKAELRQQALGKLSEEEKAALGI